MTAAGTSRTVGIALSATYIVIASGKDKEPFRGPLRPAAGDRWPSLQDALQQFLTRSGSTSLRLRIALMPPLVEVRLVELPRVGDDDARRLLTRAAGRHFLDVRDLPVVAVAPVRDSVSTVGPGALTARLAAAVASPLLSQLQRAAREAGCTVEIIVPAASAWSRTVSPGQRAVLVSCAGHQELLEVHGGVPYALRRFREHGDEDALAEAMRAVGPALTIADAPLAAAVALATSSARSWPLRFDLSTLAVTRVAPATPRWVAPVAALGVIAAAAALGLEWRAHRTLQSLRATRAMLAPQLARTAPVRLRQERIRLLSTLDGTHSYTVSRRLAAVSAALPDAAHLTRVHVRGDSMTLEGRAKRAGAVWSALNGTPAIGAVSAASPVRRETAVDGVPLDRFAFTMHAPVTR
jgi:hypothetical protein